MPTLAQRRQAPIDLPARKPLYLMSAKPARMDAGSDHLILRPEVGAPMRFPLARICRIICNRLKTQTNPEEIVGLITGAIDPADLPAEEAVAC